MRLRVTMVLLLLLFVSHLADARKPRCKRHRPPRKPEELDKERAKYTGATAKPAPVHSLDELPRNFNWCDRNGESFCAPPWNQHIPRYCGSCWIHGTLHAVNDRIKVMKGKEQRGGDVQLARQVILNCAKERGFGNGCHGGDGYDILEYMHRYGLPSESCQAYRADEGKCTEEGECMNCLQFYDERSGEQQVRCFPVLKYTKYYIKEYGTVKGEEAIMSEIFQRGPVSCGIATSEEFDYDYFGGVFWDKTNNTEVDHEVEVVGWGETEDGIKYWVIRNSWGTYWGENGFARIVRGINNMNIEQGGCQFGIPDIREEERVLDGELVGSPFGLRKKPYERQQEDGDRILKYYNDHDQDTNGEEQEQEEEAETAKQRKRKRKEEEGVSERSAPESAAASTVTAASTTAAKPSTGAGRWGGLSGSSLLVIGAAAVLLLSTVLYRTLARAIASRDYEEII